MKIRLEIPTFATLEAEADRCFGNRGKLAGEFLEAAAAIRLQIAPAR